jgi:phage terminase small subunit
MTSLFLLFGGSKAKFAYTGLVGETMTRKVTHKPRLEVKLPYETGITEMQEKFCQAYVCNPTWTQTECAIAAGYSEHSAHVTASKFLNGRDFPDVVERIRQLKEEVAKKYEVTFDNHVQMLAHIRDEAMRAGNYPAAVSAEKSRGQAAGLYVDRKEILHGRIDQMSREEVMKEIAKLTMDYPQLMAMAAPELTLKTEEYSKKE